jgi:hypothetical protein
VIALEKKTSEIKFSFLFIEQIVIAYPSYLFPVRPVVAEKLAQLCMLKRKCACFHRLTNQQIVSFCLILFVK